MTPDLTNNRGFMRVCFRKIHTMKFTITLMTFSKCVKIMCKFDIVLVINRLLLSLQTNNMSLINTFNQNDTMFSCKNPMIPLNPTLFKLSSGTSRDKLKLSTHYIKNRKSHA